MDEQEQIVSEFLVEALEKVDELDRDLVALETESDGAPIINRVFRAVHTLKGTCGFLAFSKLESVAHVGENLLDSLRAQRLTMTPDIATGLLKMVDAIRQLLGQIEATRKEGDGDYSELVALLSKLNGVSSPTPAPTPPAAVVEPALTATPAEPTTPGLVEADEATNSGPLTAQEVDELEVLFRQAQSEYDGGAGTPVPDTASPSVTEPTPEVFVEAPMSNSQPAQPSAPAEPEASAAAVAAPAHEATGESKSALADTSLRVDVALLDQLMNLVGELVLARNQILQFTKTQANADFVSTSQRLNLITSELQEQVMKTRMQPIANVWNKFPRVVRDVARSCGKKVRIEMQGKETDLDKTIIEAIKDPLTHIVRNSVDHGIEKPEVRQAKGKDPEGTLLLKAYHEGGHVIIEIGDDGAGLNTERIKAKALERGLISSDKAAHLSDQEITRLIFLPGFSTAEQVTNISGRGVGMDVVRSNIEKIGGSVDLISKQGLGTTLRIKIPLTLAIVPALIVSCGGERFAIPQVNLVELVRVAGDDIVKKVEEIKGSMFYRLRGNLLPLVYLNQELKLPRAADGESPVINIVVVKAEEQTFGLVVETVHDTEEIVVKPLGKQLKHLAVFAGATIMGDGHVAIILDVSGLAQRSRVIGGEEAKAATGESATPESAEAGVRQSLLLVQAGEKFRVAIPLSSVNRLEEFSHNEIELASGQPVVQYRGGILPLIDLAEYLSGTSAKVGENRAVVVYSSQGRFYGFVVDRILDIVEDHVNVQLNATRRGMLGSAVIQKQVTDLVDLDCIVSLWASERAGDAGMVAEESGRVA